MFNRCRALISRAADYIPQMRLMIYRNRQTAEPVKPYFASSFSLKAVRESGVLTRPARPAWRGQVGSPAHRNHGTTRRRNGRPRRAEIRNFDEPLVKRCFTPLPDQLLERSAHLLYCPDRRVNLQQLLEQNFFAFFSRRRRVEQQP